MRSLALLRIAYYWHAMLQCSKCAPVMLLCNMGAAMRHAYCMRSQYCAGIQYCMRSQCLMLWCSMSVAVQHPPGRSERRAVTVTVPP